MEKQLEEHQARQKQQQQGRLELVQLTTTEGTTESTRDGRKTWLWFVKHNTMLGGGV